MLALAEILPREIGPYMSLMIAGFLVAIAGHLTRARWLVAIGVLMIFLAAFLFPLAINFTDETPPPPALPPS